MASIIMFVNIIRLWLNDYKVLNTDVKFGIAIGNIFKKKGSIVVPINNRFKVDPKNNILTLESILAQTVKKYWNGDVTQLQNDLIKKLQGEEECYPLGKTIKITKDRKTFYFLANSNINENGNVVPVTTEELKKSLSGLWEFVKNNGDKETLLLPMISTGYGRSNNDKLSVFSLIIQSFHSKEVLGNYIDKYTICIRQSDIKRYKLNMSDFREVAYFLNKYKTIFEQ